MGNIVVNIRSTNGGGKSSIVRAILDVYNGEPILGDNGKILGYVCRNMVVPDNVHLKDLYVLGSYQNECGGCDGIPTQDDICNLVTSKSRLKSIDSIIARHLHSPGCLWSQHLLGSPWSHYLPSFL